MTGSRAERNEKLNRFSNALGKLHERWDNRFLPERDVLTKSYFKGRFEIVLNGDFTIGHREKVGWLLRIKHAVLESAAAPSASADDQLTNKNAGQCYDQIVVLVDPVQAMEGIKVTPVPVRVWLYRIDNEFFGTGQSQFYRVEFGAVRYKVFPFFMEGKKQVPPFPATDAGCGGCQMVERGAEIVHSVTNDKSKNIWDWLSWHDANPLNPLVRLHVNCVRSAFGEGGKFGLKFVNTTFGARNF